MTAEPRSTPPDAVLLLSFGGPESPDEVVPFLANVTQGTGIPRERLATVGEHYFLFGGRSPINDQNRALLVALQTELASRGVAAPLYWGNRNWTPYVADAVREVVAAGHRDIAVVTTSAYPSYAGCRSYREDLAAAIAEVPGAEAMTWRRVGNYGLDPGFLASQVDAVRAALEELPEARLVFVTHSIPTDMNETSGPDGGAYLRWHRLVAAHVADAVGATEHDLVFCSRSGRPGQPWLEPDVNDHVRDLADRGVQAVVLAPIGFVSDHMEVVYDLDTQASATCAEAGVQMVRAATPGTAPAFVTGLVDRLLGLTRAIEPGECRTPCDGRCCPNPRAEQTPAIP